MTDEQLEAFGRRWIAAGGDVRPGMVICDFEGALRVIATAAPGRLYVAGGTALDTWTVEETDWIDLSDGATKGAALEVVRERWGDPAVYLVREGDRWYAAKRDSDYVWEGDTIIGEGGSEAEALVAALEAAPEANR